MVPTRPIVTLIVITKLTVLLNLLLTLPCTCSFLLTNTRRDVEILDQIYAINYPFFPTQLQLLIGENGMTYFLMKQGDLKDKPIVELRKP